MTEHSKGLKKNLKSTVTGIGGVRQVASPTYRLCTVTVHTIMGLLNDQMNQDTQLRLQY